MGYRDKELKTLGRDTMEEMEAMMPGDLEKVILEATSSMDQVKKELEANPKYQDLKYSLSSLTAGKRDVDKRQKARIKYALERLTEIGKLGVVERLEWESETRKKRQALEEKKRKEAREKAEREAEAKATSDKDEAFSNVAKIKKG